MFPLIRSLQEIMLSNRSRNVRKLERPLTNEGEFQKLLVKRRMEALRKIKKSFKNTAA